MSDPIKKQEPPALALAQGSAISCAGCKQPMRRDPVARAWIHVHTGRIDCDAVDLVPHQYSAKPAWPNVAKCPQKVAHLRTVIGRLETPMMPNTKAAVISCLDELLRRLEAEPNNVIRPHCTP